MNESCLVCICGVQCTNFKTNLIDYGNKSEIWSTERNTPVGLLICIFRG